MGCWQWPCAALHLNMCSSSVQAGGGGSGGGAIRYDVDSPTRAHYGGGGAYGPGSLHSRAVEERMAMLESRVASSERQVGDYVCLNTSNTSCLLLICAKRKPVPLRMCRPPSAASCSSRWAH
jgi:hypothetical protein